jgi:large subunit ribosomal protein L13
MMKTIFLKPKELSRKRYLIDASDKILGKVAVKTANILRGKTKPYYAPHMEIGDFVIIVNADKIAVTGNKLADKMYYRHSGYPGGLKSQTLGKVMQKKPTFPLEHAIKGMLPKGSLGRKLFGNVKIYKGNKHPHEAQKPQVLEV